MTLSSRSNIISIDLHRVLLISYCSPTVYFYFFSENYLISQIERVREPKTEKKMSVIECKVTCKNVWRKLINFRNDFITVVYCWLLRISIVYVIRILALLQRCCNRFISIYSISFRTGNFFGWLNCKVSVRFN